MVNQIRHDAMVGTRELVYAMRHRRKVKVEMNRPCRSRKFQEGVRREVCLWSSVDTVGLYCRNLVSILEEACDSYSPPHAPLSSTHTRSLVFKSLTVRIYGDVF